MENDPDELIDVGDDPKHTDIIELMYARLGQWARRMNQRTTRSDDDLDAMRGRSRRRGILVGLFDGSEVPRELTVKLRGRPRQIFAPLTDESREAGE
jgi:hypothetical protein